MNTRTEQPYGKAKGAPHFLDIFDNLIVRINDMQVKRTLQPAIFLY